MSPKSIIEGINALSEEGVRQGSAESALLFCLMLQEDIDWAEPTND